MIEDSTITTVSASREHEAPLASAQPYLVVLTVTDDPHEAVRVVVGAFEAGSSG